MLVVFSDPQVASVGLGEKDCQEANIPYLVASYPFDDLGKSMCLGELYGHVKLLCDPRTGELIGAHIVGPEAGELIPAATGKGQDRERSKDSFSRDG